MKDRRAEGTRREMVALLGGTVAAFWAGMTPEKATSAEVSGPLSSDGRADTSLCLGLGREDLVLALQAMRDPRLQTAREEATLIWLLTKGRDALGRTERDLLHHDMEKLAFFSTLNASNSDPHFPRALQYGWPAHRRCGLDLIGTGIGIDNPDNAYFRIPVDGTSRYEIRATIDKPGPADFSVTLADNFPHTGTIGVLAGTDIVAEPDGSFVITIDSDPTWGRSNHIRSAVNARSVLIRDSLGDWSVENPHRYRVRRTGGPKAPAPLSIASLPERAAAQTVKTAADLARAFRRHTQAPVNDFTAVSSSLARGGLATQASADGNFRLRDDEALVIEVERGGAAYFNIQLCDTWGFSMEAHRRLTSLNHSQARPSGDGLYRFAVSSRDPGVHNWLDTTGVRDGIMWMRWQGLDRRRASLEGPAVRVRMAKLSSLNSAEIGHPVSLEQRRVQLSEREAGYWRRLGA